MAVALSPETELQTQGVVGGDLPVPRILVSLDILAHDLALGLEVEFGLVAAGAGHGHNTVGEELLDMGRVQALGPVLDIGLETFAAAGGKEQAGEQDCDGEEAVHFPSSW